VEQKQETSKGTDLHVSFKSSLACETPIF